MDVIGLPETERRYLWEKNSAEREGSGIIETEAFSNARTRQMILTARSWGTQVSERRRMVARRARGRRGAAEAEADRALAQSIAMAVDQAPFAATPWAQTSPKT